MDVGKSIQQSVDLYRKNFGTLLLACLIAGIISAVSLGILAGPLVGGILVLGLKLLRGEKGELNEIFTHFDQFVPTLITTLLFWGASLVWMIIGIIPVIGWLINFILGPVLGLLYFLTIGFVVDQKMRPLDALKRSIAYFAFAPLQLWLYSFLITLVGALGSLLLVVGIIFTIPLSMIGMTIAYQQLCIKETPLFKPGKQVLQIAGITLGVLVLIGIVSLVLGGGRFSRRNPGAGLASKILSGVTGQQVQIDQDGNHVKIGDMSFGAGLPENFPKDIPIYPQAEVVSYLDGEGKEVSGSTTILAAKASTSAIFTYYKTKLQNEGWTVTTSKLGEMQMVSFEKEQRKGVVTIIQGDSQTDLTITITNN